MPLAVALAPATARDYFALSDLRALPDVSDPARYPDALLVNARAWITAVIERVCQTSFVYRTFTEVLDGSRVGQDGGLVLSRSWVRQVLGVTVNGLPDFTSDQVAALDVALDGTVLRNHSQSWTGGDYYAGYGGWAGATSGSPWPRGYGNITFTYLAGYSAAPPDDLKQVALQAARYRLVNVEGKSGVPSRALSLTNELGNVALASASLTRPTGLPEVDAVILGWAQYTKIPGIA